MTDLVVIYDPDLELGAIINADERVSWGPAMIGPEAPVILQSFIDNTPFDVSTLDTFTAAAAFADFLDRLVAARTPATADPPAVPVVNASGQPMAPETVPGATHGAPTDEPPAVQPADTDSAVESNESPAGASITAGSTPFTAPEGTGSPMAGAVTYANDPNTAPAEAATVATRTQQCAMCEGGGTVQMGPDEPAAQCGMCNGTGTVTVPLAT